MMPPKHISIPPRGYPESQSAVPPQRMDAKEEKDPEMLRSSCDKASSLDIPQRIERKLAEYNASQSILKRWLFEIISWTTSALCMAAVIVILTVLKDKPLDKWPLGLTITTILSKVASAALILPISEAIGQLKWTWFTQSKEMFDFEIFDKASRGPWGSIMLLFRTKGRSLAALGALLTLLLLAIDTFFQQTTDLSERWALESSNATIPRIVRYNPDYDFSFTDGNEMVQDDPYLTTTMRSFFYSNGSESISVGNHTQPNIPLSCPGNKCDWEPYETLGVCSTCADISDILTYACLDTRLDWLSNITGYGSEDTWPNGTACGYFINATSSDPVLMSGYHANANGSEAVGEVLLSRTYPLVSIEYRETFFDGSINFKDVYFPLVDALIVGAADGTAASVIRGDRPVAQECMLAWCVKKLKSSYSLGVYQEEVISTTMNMTRYEQPYPWNVTAWNTTSGELLLDYVFASNLSIHTPTTSPDSLGFGLSNYTFLNLVALMDEVFPSVLTTGNSWGRPLMRIKFWQTKRNNVRFADFSPWLQPTNITMHLERFAAAMTNVVRSYSKGNELITGQAYSPVTVVLVQWEWLTFPLTLLLLCLVFLVATIHKTSKGPQTTGVWKTSAMPTLIYSLPHDMQKEFTSPTTWAQSSNAGAKKVRVKLLPDKGWRVSGRIYTPTTATFGGQARRPPPGWI